jgi:hypothetical protein
MTFTLSTSANMQSMSKIMLQPAIENVEPAGPMNALVTRAEIPKGHYQIDVPLWHRMTASSLSEGVDMANPTALTATVRTVTASEHGLLSFISNRLKIQNNEDVLAEIGVQHGRGLGRLLDTDLLTLVDGFTNSAPGASAAATWLHITGAISFLRTDDDSNFGPAPSMPSAVLNPEQIRRLAQEATGMQSAGTTAAAQPMPDGPGADVLKRYIRNRDPLFGVPIYEDGNISNDSGGDAKGGVFVKEALFLAVEKEINGADEDDISLRGTEVVTTGVWGETEIVDSWGVEIFSAADPVFS